MPSLKLNSVQKHKRIVEAYKKVLGGKPLKKVRLNEEDKESLRIYIANYSIGQSAFQTSQASGCTIGSVLCADLNDARKEFHRKSAEKSFLRIRRIKVKTKSK